MASTDDARHVRSDFPIFEFHINSWYYEKKSFGGLNESVFFRCQLHGLREDYLYTIQFLYNHTQKRGYIILSPKDAYKSDLPVHIFFDTNQPYEVLLFIARHHFKGIYGKVLILTYNHIVESYDTSDFLKVYDNDYEIDLINERVDVIVERSKRDFWDNFFDKRQ